MEINEVIQLEIVDLDFEGRGVGKKDGIVVYVRFALPGEKVKAKIIKKEKTYYVADLLVVNTPSPLRSTYSPSYDAIDMIHLDYKEQLKWQVKELKNTARKILGDNNFIINPIIESEPYFHYRNKLRVFPTLVGNTLKFGVKNIMKSDVYLDKEFILADKLISDFINKLNNENIEYTNEEVSAIDSLAILTSNDQLYFDLQANNKEISTYKKIIDYLQAYPKFQGLSIRKRVEGSDYQTLFSVGQTLTYTINNYKIKYSNLHFRQVNNNVSKKMYDAIKELVKDSTIIDAYCGLGSIGLSLYNVIKKVLFLDINRDNISQLKFVINLNKLTKATAYSTSFSSFLTKNPDLIKEYDTLIIDPPRAGLQDFEINHIKRSGIKKIIYISCNCITLFRNIKDLSSLYTIESVTPVSMFPQTTSTETLLVLNHK